MKKVLLALIVGMVFVANAEIIWFDTSGDPSTGDLLDGIDTGSTTINIPEITGLQMTITALLGTDAGAELNSTGTSLGINSDNDSDTDAFEAAFGQGFTFRFNQAVSITQLDFTTFSAGETVSFAGVSIGNDDLSNGTTDIYDFSTPLEISADTEITLLATSGTVGIEAMTASVIPEPATLAMFGIGGLMAMIVRRSIRT